VGNAHPAWRRLADRQTGVRGAREVIIAKAGKPVARLTAVEPHRRGREFGALRGKARVDDRFFQALPEEELQAWE
jgi:antitoxin (DNA-binding transcriptional repressor) of toxin-antitoxin stability system